MQSHSRRPKTSPSSPSSPLAFFKSFTSPYHSPSSNHSFLTHSSFPWSPIMGTSKLEKQSSIKSTVAATGEAEQGGGSGGGGGGGEHIEFTSSSSFSNQNSEEFKPQFQQNGGHIQLASSSSFSNYNHSGEFKPSRPSHHGHIELASSSSFSNYNSAEFKPPKRRERSTRGEDSSAGSSISSDRTVLIHSSPPPIKHGEERFPAAPATAQQKKPPPEKQKPENHKAPPEVKMKKPGTVKDQPEAKLKKPEAVEGNSSGNAAEEGGGGGGGGGGSRRFLRNSTSILRRSRREQMVKKLALGFRVIGLLFSFVSVSVMAANRKQGWAMDSFDNYKEFRYCIIVNLIVCIYSGAQALHLGYQLATGRGIILKHILPYFNFSIDQMVSYLLISASSSAATRVDDWRSNWGNDRFPNMASASVSFSFVAFGALASSSLLSGYFLCTSKPSP